MYRAGRAPSPPGRRQFALKIWAGQDVMPCPVFPQVERPSDEEPPQATFTSPAGAQVDTCVPGLWGRRYLLTHAALPAS